MPLDPENEAAAPPTEVPAPSPQGASAPPPQESPATRRWLWVKAQSRIHWQWLKRVSRVQWEWVKQQSVAQRHRQWSLFLVIALVWTTIRILEKHAQWPGLLGHLTLIDAPYFKSVAWDILALIVLVVLLRGVWPDVRLSPEYAKLKDGSGKFLTSDRVVRWRDRTDTFLQSDSVTTWKDSARRFLRRENFLKTTLLTLAWIASLVFLYECLLKPPLQLLDSHTPLPYSKNAAYLLIHLAWPITLIIALAAFKQPLSLLLTSIGRKGKTRSAWEDTAEFSEIPKLKPLAIPGLDEIQQMTPTAWTSDSSGRFFEQIKAATTADYAIVDIGEGKNWLTSRLFIFAVMLERMRDLPCLVFVESRDSTYRRYIGVASPSKVRWALAQRSPWLEFAYAHACATPFQDSPSTMPASATLVATFLTGVQTSHDPASPYFAPNEWVEWDGSQTSIRWERAEWLDETRLRNLLDSCLSDDAALSLPDDLPTEQAKKILRRRGTYVALVDGRERFKGLVNRQLLLENLGVRLSHSESHV